MFSAFTGETESLRFLPGVRVETNELVQDVNLHRSDLTKLIRGMNKLLYNAIKRRGNEIMQTGLNTLKPHRKLRG